MANREVRQQVYDHRLRDLVRQTGDIGIATAAGVPRSTAAGWLRRDLQPVVSVDVVDMTESDLRAEVAKLRRRTRTLSAVVALLVAVLRVSDRRTPRLDLSDRTTRAGLLRAADRARKVLPTSAVLKILGISPSRYNVWVRADQGCALPNETACPRSTPTGARPRVETTAQPTASSESDSWRESEGTGRGVAHRYLRRSSRRWKEGLASRGH